MNLPDLNKPPSARMSPKHTSILGKPSVAKIIHKANVGKEGGSMFKGLGSLLTVLCKSAQGDIASISVDSIASNAVSNALLIGPTGGSVSGSKLDDLSVSTFPTCCINVLATMDKHAFPSAGSDHIRGCDLHNSSSVARDCNLLHCTDSTVCAESSAVDNENFVHCDIASEVTDAFVSNDNDPMLKDEKIKGAVHDESTAHVKNTEVPLPPRKRDSQKKWGLSIKRGCTTRFTVKNLLHAPHISEINIFEFKHVNISVCSRYVILEETIGKYGLQ